MMEYNDIYNTCTTCTELENWKISIQNQTSAYLVSLNNFTYFITVIQLWPAMQAHMELTSYNLHDTKAFIPNKNSLFWKHFSCAHDYFACVQTIAWKVNNCKMSPSHVIESLRHWTRLQNIFFVLWNWWSVYS